LYKRYRTMANHTYSLAIAYSAQGQFANNILHYLFDDGGFASTAAAALALATAFDTANRTLLKNILPTSTTLLSVKARNVTMAGGFEGFFPIPAGQTGARTGNVAASGVSPLVILFPTAQVRSRGKVFLPGISDTDLMDGEYQTGFVTAFNTNKHLFTDNLTLVGGGAPTATPVLLNRTAMVTNTIAHAMLSMVAGTQRRRQRPA